MDYYIIATAQGIEFSGVANFSVRPKDEDSKRHCNINQIDEQTYFSVAETKNYTLKPILG